MVRWWQLPPHPLDPVRVARAASRPPPLPAWLVCHTHLPCLPFHHAYCTCHPSRGGGVGMSWVRLGGQLAVPSPSRLLSPRPPVPPAGPPLSPTPASLSCNPPWLLNTSCQQWRRVVMGGI
jgi:hypothetical protein